MLKFTIPALAIAFALPVMAQEAVPEVKPAKPESAIQSLKIDKPKVKDIEAEDRMGNFEVQEPLSNQPESNRLSSLEIQDLQIGKLKIEDIESVDELRASKIQDLKINETKINKLKPTDKIKDVEAHARLKRPEIQD